MLWTTRHEDHKDLTCAIQTLGLLDEVGQLCAGKHPASAVITRARKKVGFHWDADQIAASVTEWGKNAQLVWLEARGDEVPLHRLSSDVLAHVLFPETNTPPSSQRH